MHDERVRKRSMGFPAPLYAGLTIRISQSVGAESLSRSLPTIGLDFDALAHRLAGPSGCRIYTPDPSTRALLESFWDIDDREPLTRLRLKTLELIALANATPHPVSYTHLRARIRAPLGYRRTQQGSSCAWRA